MEVAPYTVPLGETLILETDAGLIYTEDLTPAGGTGKTRESMGRLYLTNAAIAFRPGIAEPHGQRLTVALESVLSTTAVQPRFLGLFKRPPRVNVAVQFPSGTLVASFRVDDAQHLSSRLTQAAARWNASMRRTPLQLIEQGLTDGIADRNRYQYALTALSFPQGFWHVEATDDLERMLDLSFEDLNLDLPEGFVARLLPSLDVEEYVTKDSDEQPARIEQLKRIVAAVNASLPEDEPRRIEQFAEDLPWWEHQEPVYVLLTPDLRDRLVSAGVLTPLERCGIPQE